MRPINRRNPKQPLLRLDRRLVERDPAEGGRHLRAPVARDGVECDERGEDPEGEECVDCGGEARVRVGGEGGTEEGEGGEGEGEEGGEGEEAAADCEDCAGCEGVWGLGWGWRG